LTRHHKNHAPTSTQESQQGFAALGFATIDLRRKAIKGFPEVIYGEGKTAAQLKAIALRLAATEDKLLITRLGEPEYAQLTQSIPTLQYHAEARCAFLWPKGLRLKLSLRHDSATQVGLSFPARPLAKPDILVLSAGTLDVPFAEEAALTAALLGCSVERLYDVGVAGLHRLLAHTQRLRQAKVLIVAAGMDGALASVVAGLCAQPVIGLPTPVGYGKGGQGEAALASMLQSCASGLTVVNIGNGFGAGFAAAQMIRLSRPT
jgi:pyridinium-3,5-biscarboxylic acid mononucleotide synthase